jgi:hypothetical protein
MWPYPQGKSSPYQLRRRLGGSQSRAGPSGEAKESRRRIFLENVEKLKAAQKTSWDTDSRSASQDILRLLRNPKIHYRVHKISPMNTILHQLDPAPTFRPYFFQDAF